MLLSKREMHGNQAEGVANIADPNQTAPLVVVRPGSTLKLGFSEAEPKFQFVKRKKKADDKITSANFKKNFQYKL